MVHLTWLMKKEITSSCLGLPLKLSHLDYKPNPKLKVPQAGC